jgi:hypothetical protein
MNPWDDHLGIQRVLEAAQRLNAQFRHIAENDTLSRLHNQVIERERAIDKLTTVQRMIGNLDGVRRLAAEDALERQAIFSKQFERMLRHSIVPYPNLDTSALQLNGFQDDVLSRYDRFNRALEGALFLATVELEDDEVDDETDLPEVERQLVQVVPAEAVELLGRVQFAPFSLLSAAVARPETLFELTSRTFEEFIAELVARLGLQDVILTQPKADGGRDVIGIKRVLGIPLIFAFECKRYRPDKAVSVHYARALLGTISHADSRADRGVLVTTSRFTEPARRFIVSSPQLAGTDFNGIVAWLMEYAQGNLAHFS